MKKHVVIVVGISFLIAGSGLLAAAEESKQDAINKERKKLEGTWKVAALEEDGNKPVSDEQLEQVEVTIDANGKVVVQSGGNTVLEATTEIDPTKKPKTVDITFTEGERKGQSALGIYELEGDTYRYCRALPGKPRPNEFSGKAGSGNTLVVYKRVKSK